MKMVHLKIKKKQTIVIVLGVVGLLLYVFFLNKNRHNDNKVYVLKEFNSTGKLIGTNEYITRNGDTIIHGKFINYNDKGKKISEGQFVNGDIYGKCTDYYDNGNVESSYYKKTSKITLEAIWNYPNGNIERYALYEGNGRPIFIIKYDEKGVIDSYKGNPQLEIYQHKVNISNHQYEQIKNSLKVGDKFKYSYIVANIPNAKRSFKIENLSVDNSKVKRTQKNILPAQIDVEEVLTKKGKNTIRSIVKYEFNDKVMPVFTDTLSFDVIVN